MDMYRSEEVIESLNARLHPTDKRVPECGCYIILTSGHVFISEDNYDGTYEDHYILDLAQIDEIKISEPYKTSIGYTGVSLDKKAGVKSVDRRTGHIRDIFFGSKKRHGALDPAEEAASRKFLEIIYRGDHERKEHLFFDECNGDPANFINAFCKRKQDNNYWLWLRERISEQAAVYAQVKDGDLSSIRYEKAYEKERGTYDRNYTERNRLSHYLLYEKIDDEKVIETLFEEELKDRKTNSFQGIGETIQILTFLLQRYNNTGKYSGLFEKAENANFDCAAGYDKDVIVNDSLPSLDLIECIYLSNELRYMDIMEQLVTEWKAGVKEWNDDKREMLIRFNGLLGKNNENEEHYIKMLESAKKKGKCIDIVSAYNKIIELYISEDRFEAAYSYMREMIDTTDFTEIQMIRLFKAVLEDCFEIVCGLSDTPVDLWEWAKKHLLTMGKKEKFGNLYVKSIAAAKCCGDEIAEDLEKEYADWKEEVRIK